MPYSKRDTEYLIEEYTKDPCIETVNRLCVELNKTPKSIISKLSSEGHYVKVGYRDKTGAIPVKKDEIVAEIENVYGCKLSNLSKAPKDTLKLLRDLILEQDKTLNEALSSLADLSETSEIKSSMLRARIRAVD